MIIDMKGIWKTMIDYSVLRMQPTEKLHAIHGSVESLLSNSEILPAELVIKLDTLRADLASILEDREDLGDPG